MTPAQYAKALTRYSWLIAACLLVGTSVGLGVSAGSSPRYSATANVVVSPTPRATATASEAYAATLLAQQRMATLEQLANDPSVMDDVIDELGLDVSPSGLAEQLTIVVPSGGLVLQTSFAGDEPDQVERVVDAASRLVVEVVNRAEQSRTRTPLLRARVADEAPTLVREDAPPGWRNPALGALGGLLLGAALAVVWARSDRRLRDPDTVSSELDAPVLGVVTVRGRRRRPGAGRRSTAADQEQIRALRTSLFFSRPSGSTCFTVALTSPRIIAELPGVATALASSLAETGARVLLVEADLRTPTLADRLHIDDHVSRGLTSHLRNDTGAAVVQRHAALGCDVIVAGAPSADEAADLLLSYAFSQVLDDAADRYDFVLVLAPPTSAGSDAAAVAAQTDAVVVAVARGTTRRIDLRLAARRLAVTGSHVAGAVVLR